MSTDVLDREYLDAVFDDGVDLSDPFVVLALAAISIERLRHTDTAELSDEERRHFTAGVEALRNQADAAAVDAARRTDAAGHERGHGYFTTSAWLRHHLGLSSTESRVRMQVVRMLDALPAWGRAARNGQLGLEQLRAAARTFALVQVREAFVEQSDRLLHDAVTVSCARFEELLANLRRLADADGDRRTAKRHHEGRHLSLRRHADGTWRLSGRFGALQGAEINHHLAQFIDAEWRSDWADATERSAPEAAVGLDDLRRTEPQRRADALHQMVLAASEHPGPGAAPLPTLNVLIDWDTFTTELNRTAGGPTHDPSRYRDLVCRTQDGEPIPVAEASAAALYAHVRRVVLDSAGVVTDLGRRRRLFTGAAREAVMLPHDTCVWFGCEAPVRRAHADHTVEWGRRSGTTSPDNGAPLCAAHNLLKERRRYVVERRTDGTFDITTPDGTPLG